MRVSLLILAMLFTPKIWGFQKPRPMFSDEPDAQFHRCIARIRYNIEDRKTKRLSDTKHEVLEVSQIIDRTQSETYDEDFPLKAIHEKFISWAEKVRETKGDLFYAQGRLFLQHGSVE